ncbi:similar to RIKEN cDNA 2810489O06 (predicted), isoform CRA_b [Rattus norvegicus]|uniref:Similar to RIKEN cDNA 2810489O06 (Predicted), isoform CRA_b n=1 Tax=Rattus norvegicus TaxID=10116 RepID=A6JV94_RAT|nr:similar to RIKEN cDNA 2810489O06 (predicted), isoform CRA_b [Rattus norvegicus]
MHTCAHICTGHMHTSYSHITCTHHMHKSYAYIESIRHTHRSPRHCTGGQLCTVAPVSFFKIYISTASSPSIH